MKLYLVVAAVLIFLWWHHNQKQQQQRRQRGPGVARTLDSGGRNATQLSGTGSVSPGSGVLVMQPAMGTTWGIGGGTVLGLTGPAYSRRPKTGTGQ
jgi:hypothetical protein